MIEDYGSLSEEEMIQEIQKQLDNHAEIDASGLEFKYENGRLIVSGAIQTEEEMEALVHILEDYVDPKDYNMEVEIAEASVRVDENFEEPFQAEEEEEDEDELEDLEEFDEEDMEEEDEIEDEEFDDDKW
jgi:hypothetical protein